MGFGVRAPCVERVRAFGRAGRAWDTRQYIGQHLGCASGVAYPFAEQGPNGRLSLSCVAHSVGEMVLCRSYAQVYLLQGFLLFLVASPVLLINGSVATGLGMLDALGMAVWLVGFSFEAVGDAQLARFIKDPVNKGKLMQGGLWAYTRHPNYFGEVTQWWGLWLVALSVPGGWLGIIGPMTITFLILKVSGVPMLERKMQEHPEFAAYERRVSMFIPLPPRT